MSPLTQEWVDKAEEDFFVARREYRARKNPSFNAACFRAQQCVEKYLKARLQEAGIAFAKTHSLPLLLNLVSGVEPLWVSLRSHLDRLNVYAIAFRYPGPKPTPSRLWRTARSCGEKRD